MHHRRRWILAPLAAALGTAAAAPPDDPLYPLQWGLGPDGINVEGAWARGLDGSGVRIGIIDSGVVVHEDLPLPQGGYDFLSDPTRSRDGGGRDPDPTDEGDWTDKYASSWHGTHVAGILQAVSGNALGIAGIAPGASVEHLRIAGGSEDDQVRARAKLQDLASALSWAAGGAVPGVPARDAPLDIVVISSPVVHDPQECTGSLQDAVDLAVAAGVVVIAAAHDFTYSDAGEVVPGNCDGVIAVGGVNQDNAHAPETAYGDVIAVAAPSGGPFGDEDTHVLSTVDAGEEVAIGPDYGWARGTGVAAAHVAGTVALMLQQDPSLARDRIVGILRSTGYASHGFVDGCDTDERRCGVRIDASRALAVVAGDERMPPRVPAYPYPPSHPLVNGVPIAVPPLTGHRVYRVEVPEGARSLEFELERPPGATGLVYMYVRHGRVATLARNDCDTEPPPFGRSRCVFVAPAPGTWYVRLEGPVDDPAQRYQLVARYRGRTGAPDPGTSR